MAPVPQVRLTVDLQKINRYFPLEFTAEGRLDYDMVIDRPRYDRIETFLRKYGIAGSQVVQEYCFIILWIEKYTGIFDEEDNLRGKFYQMWLEVDHLKEYLLKHRITSIVLKGEGARNKPGPSFTLREEINIDRICDGIRTVFRDEFDHDKANRRSKGQRTWKKRKMIKVRNRVMNYLNASPHANLLSLEDQSDIIAELAALADCQE